MNCGHFDIWYHWIIDNAAAKFASGKAESEVFNGGGFEWKAGFRPKDSDSIEFTLTCDHPRKSGQWKCEADFQLSMFNVLLGMTSLWYEQRNVKFNHDDKVFELLPLRKSCVKDKDYKMLKDDRVRMTYSIKISSSEFFPIVNLSKFSSPSEMNNVILVIGDKKLEVSKEYLAVHSPVFSAMFYGDFAEKGKEEVEIKDVIYGEFLDFLQLIFPGMTEITDHTVLHILKLADRFQVEHVVALSRKHLLGSSNLDILKKLKAADQFGFDDVRNRCLSYELSFCRVTELIGKLRESLEFSNFSADMKVAICEQIVRKGR